MVLLLGLWVRSAGLLHGLSEAGTFHPDETKQVQAVRNFMNGDLLWYTGSLAYDGYPYGLNQVDAALLRVLWHAVRPFAEAVDPSLALPAVPDRDTLFVLCRMLRVGYGFLALLAFRHALRRRGVPPVQTLGVLLLAALHPLLTTVTHSASGDVGTDLFVMLSLAALSHTRREVRPGPYALAGFFIGCAFASKYHGLLAAASPALLLLASPHPWRRRIPAGLACALGAVTGFALLTPALFIRFSKTLQLIRDNFRYIRRYGAEPGFFDLPFLERAFISLRSNLPTVGEALGPVLLLCALVLAVHAWVRVRQDKDAAWDAAVLTMPFATLALALIGKPSLQPFHFSFLPLPLLLGCAGASLRLRPPARIPILLAAIVLLSGFIPAQRVDLLLWTREDTRQVAFRLSESLLEPLSETRNPRAHGLLAFEGENLGVFRNLPRPLLLSGAEAWEKAPRQALPSIPFMASPDWIPLDLPNFPRDPRLVHLHAGEHWQRLLVDTPGQARLPISLRAGERPAHLRATLNGRTHTLALRPGESRVIEMDAVLGVPFVRDGHKRVRHHVALRALGGDLLVRFGEVDPPGDPELLADKLVRARFLDGTLRFPAGRSTALLLDAAPLPPARYRLEIDWPGGMPNPVLWIDNAGLPHPSLRREVPLLRMGNGRLSAEWEETAPPLFSRLTLSGSHHPPRPLSWSLKPLSTLPEATPAPTIPPLFSPEMAFDGGRLLIGNIELPSTLSVGAPLLAGLRMRIDPFHAPELLERVLFIHLLDTTGRQVFARDIPLPRIADADSALAPFHDLGPLELPPGDYSVTIGLYHPATHVRSRPVSLGETSPTSGRRLRVATLHLLP